MKKTRIQRMASLLLVCLLLSQVAFAWAQSFPYTAQATDSVNLREQPNGSAKILTVIKKGDSVSVTGEKDNYKMVSYEGRTGYVVSTFLTEEAKPIATVRVAAKVAQRYPTLAAGDKGPSVKALQEALQELGFYTSRIDSEYGGGTTQAVSDFQEKNRLPKNGVADAAMQKLLYEGRPRNSKNNATQVKTLPPIADVTIRPGNRGDAVALLQQQLKDLKLYTGSVDGVYGKASENAVRAFQKEHKLKVDGLVGEKTRQAIVQAAGGTLPGVQNTVSSALPEVSPSPTMAPAGTEPPATYPYTTTSNSSVNLRKRANASAMRMVTVPQGASVEVLEDAGDYLKVVYKKFVGYVVRDYINVPEQYLKGKVLRADNQARLDYETLAVGAEGRQVRAMQQALTELGFYSGVVDGKFGAGTISALKAFQKRNSLRETGIALPELQKMLYEQRVRNNKNKLVAIKTLPPIEGVTMGEGDYGDAVYDLHQLLKQTGLYDSAIGYSYTKATANAVRAFQKEHSIKQTGKVDAFTALAIRTAVAPANPTADPSLTGGFTQDNYVLIQSGSTGDAVRNLQARLVSLGYYQITPDGNFKAADVAAIRQFQRINGLNVSGVADLATQQTLYAAYALRADAQTTVPSGQTAGGLMKIGSTGEDVRALQTRLVALNYLTGNADGIFGTQTAIAVTSFQKANNLKADGLAGSQTVAAIYNVNAKANQVQSQQPGTAPEEVLKVGSTGASVVSLQQRLIALGYLKGNADGIFGTSTFLAVKAFQANNKLAADGMAGKLTVAAVNASTAIASGGLSVPPVPTPAPVPEAQPTFTAPRASEVRYANWYTEIRPIAQRLRNVVIYDFITGKHYNFRFFSLGKHADGDTPTKEDTAIMNSIMGANNWTPRPVWVIFSDGRVYMASTHSHGHETDYTSGNDLTGHLCVHFPREMDEAALTGPYAVSHQNAILAGWDLTKNMAK